MRASAIEGAVGVADVIVLLRRAGGGGREELSETHERVSEDEQNVRKTNNEIKTSTHVLERTKPNKIC